MNIAEREKVYGEKGTKLKEQSLLSAIKRSFGNTPSASNRWHAGTLARGVGRNQIGKRMGISHAANARKSIIGDEVEADVCESKTIGICLDAQTEGFKVKFGNYVDVEGLIAAPLSNPPKFEGPGPTHAPTTWHDDQLHHRRDPPLFDPRNDSGRARCRFQWGGATAGASSVPRESG